MGAAIFGQLNLIDDVSCVWSSSDRGGKTNACFCADVTSRLACLSTNFTDSLFAFTGFSIKSCIFVDIFEMSTTLNSTGATV